MPTLLHITVATRNGVKPVESGRRATKYGFDKTRPYKMSGVWKRYKTLYTGIFLDAGGHMTWEFNPNGCRFPDGVKEGDAATVEIYGVYSDEDVDCLIVKWNGITTQPPKQ